MASSAQTTTLQINCVHWIASFPPIEAAITNKILGNLVPFLLQNSISLVRHNPTDAQSLDAILQSIATSAANGARPILHFDMHGSRDYGLAIEASGELYSWPRLGAKLRAINIAAQNNLTIVFSVCYGFRAILQAELNKPCPFAIAIGPQDTVLLGFLHANTFPFYRDVFTSNKLVDAFQAHLASKMSLFNAEEALAKAIVRYLREQVFGRGGAVRIEKLVGQSVRAAGLANTRRHRRQFRRKISRALRPSQELIDRFAPTFLIGKSHHLHIKDLVSAARRKLRGA